MTLTDGRTIRTSPSWAGRVCDWGKTGLLGCFSLYIIFILSVVSLLISPHKACNLHPFTQYKFLDICACCRVTPLSLTVSPPEHYPGCEAPPVASQPQLGLLALAPDSLAEVTSCLGVSICPVGIRGCLSPVSGDQQTMSQITAGEAQRGRKRLLPEPEPIWLMQGLGFAGNPARCFRESVIKQGEHRVPTR